MYISKGLFDNETPFGSENFNDGLLSWNIYASLDLN